MSRQTKKIAVDVDRGSWRFGPLLELLLSGEWLAGC